MEEIKDLIVRIVKEEKLSYGLEINTSNTKIIIFITEMP